VGTIAVRFDRFRVQSLTAHTPVTKATILPEMSIGLTPRVLLKIMPLSALAAILIAASSRAISR